MGRSGEICAGPERIGNYVLSDRRGRMIEPGRGALPAGVSFLLCNSCYWCASEIGGMGIRKCPACKHAVEPLTIAAGERFRFDYDQKRGVRLVFRSG